MIYLITGSGAAEQEVKVLLSRYIQVPLPEGGRILHGGVPGVTQWASAQRVPCLEYPASSEEEGEEVSIYLHNEAMLHDAIDLGGIRRLPVTLIVVSDPQVREVSDMIRQFTDAARVNEAICGPNMVLVQEEDEEEAW